MRSITDSSLSEHLLETRKQVRKLFFRIWGGGFFLVLVGFAVAWFFIQPAPPKKIVLAAGPKDGAYYQFGKMYSDYLKPQGIELEIRESAGTVENYEWLLEDNDVDLAIVQGGVASEAHFESEELETLGSLFFEPIWVFHRADKTIEDVRDFAHCRIAIGAEKSGSAAFAEALLGENGLAGLDDTNFIHTGGQQAVLDLVAGDVDVAMFVISPESDLVQQLIPRDDVKLLDIERAEAYERRHPYLTSLILEQGVLDLEKDLPRTDKKMIAPVANLVATNDLHEALVPMLLRAATVTHNQVSSIFAPGRLPSTEFAEFPMNPSAQRYFDDGPPFLQKYLPFWVASAIDRGKILLLPAVTLLLPLFRIAPPLYRWRIRSRIYRWYEVLRGIEFSIRSGAEADKLNMHAQTLAEMESELDKLKDLPLSYMDEFYNLRIHVEFVERRVAKAIQEAMHSSVDEERPESEKEPEEVS